jgi:hypothetical protein
MQRYEPSEWMDATDNGTYYLASDVDARIAELEKALNEVLMNATTTTQLADHCLVPREVLGKVRSLMGALSNAYW